jgi:hypothetical protein
MRASRLNQLVLAAAATLATAGSAQAQYYGPGPLYQNREEIRQLTAHLEAQVQFVLQTAQQATGYGSTAEQQQAVYTLQLLSQAVTQMRVAVDGWNGTHDIGYDEFIRVQQLQDQAEREVYAFYYSAQEIQQALDEIDNTLARLAFLYQRPGDVVTGPGGALQLVRDALMQITLLRQQMESEAYYGDASKQAALRDVRQAEFDARQLLSRVQDRFDHPSNADREFAQLRAALNNLRANLYYAGFSINVHNQLNLVLSRVRQLSVYFRGHAPVIVRPLPPRRPPVIVVRPPYGRPGYPYPGRPPVVRPRPPRPPVIVTPPPRRPGGVIVTPPVGPRRPGRVVVTPPPGGRPGGRVIVNPPPGRRPR